MENVSMDNEMYMRQYEKAHRRGKIAGGLVLLTAGTLFLAREMGTEFPHWVFSWKMILIAIGLISAFKHGFRRMGWLIPITVGVAFIVADLYPEFSIKPFILPVVLILAGLFFIFKPSRRHHRHYWHHRRYGRHYSASAMGASRSNEGNTEQHDYLDTTSFLGGVKKNVISKMFRGGEITNVFGGSEINLMQADFAEQATLDITQVFGGTKLIIPSHWQIRTTVVTVFGGVEDKRIVKPGPENEKAKLLILEGSNFFGGIEISSY